MAGPCSIESEKQFRETAEHVKTYGAHILRGGMYKLRTSPESFQGLGSDAFGLVKRIKSEVGMPFISEVTDPRQIADMMNFVDVFQVGSRNMHNYALLKELGQTDKPVLLKRGFAGTIKEWLLAAEYVCKGGNENVALCERGIRTFETATRNTFDINAIAYIKQHSQFPVIADTSHGTGETSLVTPVALAAAAAGADGLIVETHPNPSEAQSDGFQALNFDQFQSLMESLPKVLEAVGRKMHPAL
jgi:3-deoxy-7-phosphoheptulonate synthase